MPRPIRAAIFPAALRHNLEVVRSHTPGRHVWAVAKANAYGHGLERVLPAFAAADGLAVLDLDEAQRARDAGWSRPILLLEGFFAPADLTMVEALDLTVAIHHPEQLAMLGAHRAARAIRAYLKFNTGMNRLGFPIEDAAAVVARAQALSLSIDALMMHFANADAARGSELDATVAAQWQRFQDHTAFWRGTRSVANSAAVLLHPEIGGDWVRPGIALYGASTVAGQSAASLGLKPAMSLRGRVLSVQQVPAGGAVGYGSRWRATRPSRIGIVACGYADGYPRHAPDGTPVAFGERIVPLAGRVSMDMITVDLTDAPEVNVGAEAELWGERVPIDTVAERSGTVGYELMCALARRVPVSVEN